MAQKKDKEQWIEDVMSSLSDVSRLPAIPGMYDRVMARVADFQGEHKRIRLMVTRVAAAAILLLLVNLGSVAYYMHQQQAERPGVAESINAQLESLTTGTF